jgi:hypothetical protein
MHIYKYTHAHTVYKKEVQDAEVQYGCSFSVNDNHFPGTLLSAF